MWTSRSRRRGQSSFEMAMLFTFMLATLIAFMLVIGNRYVAAQQNKMKTSLDNVKETIDIEMRIGATAQNGYVRSFTVPHKVLGLPIAVSFYNATRLGAPGSPSNFSEVDLKYLNTSDAYETFIILPDNIDGNVSIGENQMRKINGVLYVHPVG